MQTALIIAIVLVQTAVLVWLLISRGAKNAASNEQGEAQLVQTLQTQLASLNQQTVQTVLQQLNVQRESQERHSGSLGQTLRDLQSKVAQLEEGNKRVLDMSSGIKELQSILQAPKLRGTQGEIWLEELLRQMLPSDRFVMQHIFKTGDTVDALLLLRDNYKVSIDSKFSLENFRKMVAAENPEEAKVHEKAFSSDVKKRIDEIAKKYILPDEGTLSFAFMYVPAENVYYQAFVEDRGGSNLQRYAFEKHVIPVSPNSLYPYLEIVLLGLRGLQIEQQARSIQDGISGIMGEINKFIQEYDKVGKHLKNATQTFNASTHRLAKVSTKMNTLSLSTGETIELLEDDIALITEEAGE